VADLGLDQILVYRFDADGSELRPHDSFPKAEVEAGSGPRHLSFHPEADYAYAINELNSTITIFGYEPAKGRLEAIQTITTLPPDFDGENYTAEIVVHPSGKFVFGSNRGHDSIAVFRVNLESGKLDPVQVTATQGKTPRNFAVDPTGKYLLAENQDSDTIVVFRIDPSDGRLTATGHSLEVPKPVCIKFVVN
jgi:6-phosphogluconolactonase